jgi:hypothetical protein
LYYPLGYRNPSLPNLIWIHWRESLPDTIKNSTSISIPKNWKKLPHISQDTIKSCPFCPTHATIATKHCGNLEHLHIYCQAPLLVKTRDFCHDKMEQAIFNIYDFASMLEYDIPLSSAPRSPSLQEHLEQMALDIETMSRPVIINSQCKMETRSINKAILRPHALTMATLLHQLPVSLAQQYNKYPLAHRLGFIHCILEHQLDLALATITDVAFLGLFPKQLLQILHRYTYTIQSPSHKEQYQQLVYMLITSFVYRPIILQKVIHIMLAKQKTSVMTNSAAMDSDSTTPMRSRLQQQQTQSCTTPRPPDNQSHTTHRSANPPSRTCHATKCQLLHAKGIIRRPMICANNKNTCSGCSNEASQHRKTHLLEHDILTQSIPNERIAPVLKWLHTPTLLKTIRQGLSYLPTFQSTKRDDHIFGATRYLAHSVAPAPSLYSSYLHLCLTPAQDAQFNAHGKSRATHVWLASLLPSSTATPSTSVTLHNFNNGYARGILMTVLITWNDPPLLDNSTTHPLTPAYISYVCAI